MSYFCKETKGVKVHIYEDALSNLRLLQADKKYPLTAFRYDVARPKAIINCSYFTSTYVIGRNQGDLVQDTSSYADKQWLGFVLKKDGTYRCGKLDWWDDIESECGFTPACICIMDGQDVSLCSPELAGSYSSKMSLATGVTMMGITKTKRVILVTAEKGLSGTNLMTYLKSLYDLEFLCNLDGGGSSQMLVGNEYKQASTDSGGTRAMFNGLAIVNVEPQVATLCFRDYKDQELISSVTQGQLEGTHIQLCGANDFAGRTATDRVDMLAPCDMKVMAIATGDNTVFYESLEEVITPVGKTKIWAMLTHTLDSDFQAMGIKVGKIFPQGEPIACEGNKGIGSGYHIHSEFGTGTFSGGSTPYYWDGTYFDYGEKQYRQYRPCINGEERPIEEVLFLKDVEIVPAKSTGLTILDYYPNMKKVSDLNKPVVEPEPNELELRIQELEAVVADMEAKAIVDSAKIDELQNKLVAANQSVADYEALIQDTQELVNDLEASLVNTNQQLEQVRIYNAELAEERINLLNEIEFKDNKLTRLETTLTIIKEAIEEMNKD